MKFLIVDDETDIVGLIAIFLEGLWGDRVQITTASSGNQAVEILKKDPHFNCVICDFTMPNGKGDVVQKQILEQKLKIPFVLCSAHDQDFIDKNLPAPPDALVLKPFGLQALRAVFQKLRLGQDKLLQLQEETDYCKFPPTELLQRGTLSTDLYVKLSDNKYVKIMNQGDVFSQDDLHHYQGMDLKYLYLRKDDFVNLLDQMLKDFQNLGTMVSNLEDQTLTLPIKVHTMAREFLNRFGIDEKIKQVINESIDLTVKFIKAQPQLNDLFKKLELMEGSYLSTHSILLSYISCALAAQMEWVSSATNTKLATAAFMHDITLDDLTVEQCLKLEQQIIQKEVPIISNETMLKYHNHPLHAAEAVAKSVTNLPDVSVIIAQHHELPDGTGFPHRLTALMISPMSAVLIVAHHIVDIYFQSPKSFDLVSAVNQLPPSFHSGQFRPVVRALSDFVMKKNK
jgi:response regulator RpfG family c-di-GMP phosphodiesterase